jgi:hypothetical protein
LDHYSGINSRRDSRKMYHLDLWRTLALSLAYEVGPEVGPEGWPQLVSRDVGPEVRPLVAVRRFGQREDQMSDLKHGRSWVQVQVRSQPRRRTIEIGAQKYSVGVGRNRGTADEPWNHYSTRTEYNNLKMGKY